MILNVPFISQEKIEKVGEDPNWCALTCLWMVMNFYKKTPTLEELHSKYQSRLESSPVFSKVGIEHKDLLKIARDFGFGGFRKSWFVQPGVQTLIDKFKSEGETDFDISEWEKTNLEEGLFTLENQIKQGRPVIVSTSKDFSPSIHTHVVVLVGVEDDSYILHDPFKKGANYKLLKDEFRKNWLKQAIIIYVNS